ncbi:MAG: restriction endonuclease subunit S [Paludibacteraceae bacterium]|nr:restriction endonuclease subunit S [Paludibacteraceae bacterium]
MSRTMKDSGIPWIGEIPEGWKVNMLSSLFDEHKQKNKDLSESNLLSLSYGKIVRKDINTKEGLLPESFEGYNIISNGDIVFRLTDLQNDKRSLRTGLCLESGIITSAYVTIRARQQLYSPYYHYLVHSYDVCKVFYGMGDGVRQGMNYSDLRRLLLITPPLAEQHLIATFLDKKCSEIDSLIELQEQMIEELKAYKQSVITEAVTKGIRNEELGVRNYKDSGIECIGKIPTHWEVKLLRFVLDNLDYLREPISAEHRQRNNPIYDYYGASGVIDKIDYYNVDDTVLLIGEDGANLRMRNIPLIYKASGKFWVNNHAHILKPISDNYNYLAMLLEALDYSDFITGSAQPKLSQDNLKKVRLCIPPLAEQQAIADYLDKKCGEIDELITIKQQKIESLKEYKKSVIYEYVTGKKEP